MASPYEYWGTQEAHDYSPDVTGRVTDRILARQEHSKDPFFVWWSVAAPHREDVATTLLGRAGPDPAPPERYADEVGDYDLPMPPSFNEADISDKSSNLTSTAPLLNEATIDRLESNYEGRVGSLLAVDDQVGRMVQTLRDTGELDNTLIVFTSDNGWLQGEHRITGDKFLPYEESLQVPLVMRGPGVPEGKTISRQVGNMDMAPTLVDVANAKAGRKMDGISLLPGLRNPNWIPRRVLRDRGARAAVRRRRSGEQVGPPYSGVRTANFTYVVWTETGEEELYDRDGRPLPAHQPRRRPRLRAYQGLPGREARPSSKIAVGRRAPSVPSGDSRRHLRGVVAGQLHPLRPAPSRTGARTCSSS